MSEMKTNTDKITNHLEAMTKQLQSKKNADAQVGCQMKQHNFIEIDLKPFSKFFLPERHKTFVNSKDFL